MTTYGQQAAAPLTAKGVNGQISFDGATITILRKGFIARATLGKGERRIPVGSVASVQWKPAGIINGYLQLGIPGSVERRSGFGRQTRDASHDENAIVFHTRQQAAMERVRAAIEAAIANRYATPPAPTARGSVADELAKLHSLVQQGALTPVEFERHKRRLLG